MNSDHNSNLLKLEIILGAWWLLKSSGKGAGKSWEWWSGVERGGVRLGGKMGDMYSIFKNMGEMTEQPPVFATLWKLQKL
nr:hypothetical protein [Tanacetum cinerariifolium]